MRTYLLLLLLSGLLAVTGCNSTSTKDPAPEATATEAGSPAEIKSPAVARPSSVTILNASYDPTREFYTEFNQVFAEHWKEKTGQQVEVQQSHAGSGKQARAVIDGLEADVVTLSVGYDLNAIARTKLMRDDWQARLPNNSCPYTSTIVFLVRKGNPKGIKDWGDLTQPGMELVTPNPKTGGASRWCYLAAWGYALNRELGDLQALTDPAKADAVAAADSKARQFVSDLYKRVVVLDSGSRASAQSFTTRSIGDALLTWENEALLILKQPDAADFEMVVPSISILAEPAVSVVDKVVDSKKTREVATAYLEHLYSPRGQQLAAKHFYRPALPESVPSSETSQFAKAKLFSIDDVFGGWDKAQARHFDDGGLFDQMYAP